MDGYEHWAAQPRTSHHPLTYVCAATGYLMGHITTISTTMKAVSIEDASSMFGTLLAAAGLVNGSSYSIVRKDEA
jgi:hypothetical protein